MVLVSPDREARTEEIRRKASLLELAREASPKLRRTGREWRGPCPIHQGEGPNFAVNPASGVYHCHVCGVGGDVFDFVQQWQGLDFAGARAFLAQRVGVWLDEPTAAGLRPSPSRERTPGSAPRGRTPTPQKTPAKTPWKTAAETADRPWSARTAEERERTALEWRRRVAAEGASDWATPAAVYTALRDVLPLGDTATAYLQTRGIDPERAYAMGVRSIEDWGALPAVLDGLGFDPWECVLAGLHVHTRFLLPNERMQERPDRTTPAFASFDIPALAFFYVAKGGVAAGVRLRAIASPERLAACFPEPDRWRYLSLRSNGPRLPWGADALAGLAGERLHVTEGEPDALSLRMHGVRAIGIPGASSVPGGERAPWLTAAGRASRILVWYDDDRGGDRGAPRLRDALRAANGWSDAETRRRVRRVRIRNSEKTDVNDLHRAGLLASVLAELRTA